MNKRILSAAISCCLAAPAMADGLDMAPSAMMYVQIPFDGTPRGTGANNFGMRLDWNQRERGIGLYQLTRPGLFDVRLQNQQIHDVRFSGIPLLSRDQQTNELNIGGLELGPEQAILLGAVATGTIMCLTETAICSDNNAAGGGGGAR